MYFILPLFSITRDPIGTTPPKKEGSALVDLLDLELGAAGGAPAMEGAVGGDPWAPVQKSAMGGAAGDPWSGSSSTVTSPQDPWAGGAVGGAAAVVAGKSARMGSIHQIYDRYLFVP